MIIAKKNAAYYLSFPAVDSTTPAGFATGLSPVDTAYYKDGAGVWTSLAITDTATEIASTGMYEIDLTAAEMNHDKVLISFNVSGMAATAFMFDLRAKLTDDLQDLTAAQVNTEVDTGISDAALATAAELTKVPKSDGTASWNATALAAINAEADTALTDYDAPTKAELDSGLALLATSAKQDTMETSLNAVLVDTASGGIVKNATYSNFAFPMVLTSDHYTAATGKTVTGEMRIDNAAFVAVNGTISEVSDGVYECDLTADDTNGDIITYKFSEGTCDDTIITVTTRA